jgi:hypothetical protein
MRISLFFSLPKTLLFCCLALLVSTSSFAQDNDPFKPRSGKSNQNPFGKSDDNPFGGKRPAAKAVGSAEQQKDQKILALESAMKDMRQQNTMIRRENEILKQKCNSLINEKSELDQSVSKNNEMHQRIFETLLNSDDSTQQQLAVKHLIACIDQEDAQQAFLDEFRRKYGDGFTAPAQHEQLSLDTNKPEILRRLTQIVDTDSDFQFLTARALSAVSRDSAINLGFQFGPNWEPTSRHDSPQEAKIYQVFRKPVSLHYEETLLDEIVEEFQERFGVHVVLSDDVNGQTKIIFRASMLEFDGVLARMLDKYDLAYRVLDDQIVVMKKSDDRLGKSETYNVRGLLTTKLDIGGLVKLIVQNSEADSVSVNAVDQNRIVVKGTEADQRRVGQFLGSLAKPGKW